jgi:hypothetical protein
VSLKLYHFTDDAGAAGIRECGFARSNLLDTPEASWLATTRESAEMTASHDGWIIEVTIPDEVAAQYRSRFADGETYLDNYRVPWVVLNTHQPFGFERVTRSSPEDRRDADSNS